MGQLNERLRDFIGVWLSIHKGPGSEVPTVCIRATQEGNVWVFAAFLISNFQFPA
jgi:hypothetical protein